MAHKRKSLTRRKLNALEPIHQAGIPELKEKFLAAPDRAVSTTSLCVIRATDELENKKLF
jgi:hypothetical protein